ncbi:MAG: homoserine dehydrogenase [Chloroflexi bacterium]|nr:homoserine dehydrogenase [Chloroflexota bacterium]
MEPVGIGLIGIGNIGKEVFSYLRGVEDVRVLRIARRRVNAPAPAAIKKLVTGRAQTVIDDPAVDIIVEVTGDAERGAQYILDSIDSGKHVVTANKAAIAVRWREIMALARKRGVSVGFEATVGGGMPVVRAVQRHDANDDVRNFAGILNGTSNFILGRMKEYIVRHMDDPQIQKRSLPLEDALAEAQRLGYAEPDPTMDINGFDTKFKVAILANLAFDSYFDPNDIYCEGIWDLSQRILASDFYFLHHQRYLGGKYALKLVGVAERTGRRPTLRVHPALIETDGPLGDLAAVEQNFNGITLEGRRLGTQFIKGLGAGPKPTAISIASDVREIAAAVLRSRGAAANAGPSVPSARRGGSPGNFDRVRTRGYIRSVSPDVKGIYAKKLDILARHKVNVQSVVNIKEFVYGRDRYMPDYIEIDPAPDGAVREVLKAFGRLRGVRDPMYFRILEL